MKFDAAIDGGMDEADRILFTNGFLSEVKTAKPDHGNVHAGFSQTAIRNVATSFDSCHLSLLFAGCNRAQNYRRNGLHKSSSLHISLAALG